jgi:hypothetical protein
MATPQKSRPVITAMNGFFILFSWFMIFVNKNEYTHPFASADTNSGKIIGRLKEN